MNTKTNTVAGRFLQLFDVRQTVDVSFTCKLQIDMSRSVNVNTNFI